MIMSIKINSKGWWTINLIEPMSCDCTKWVSWPQSNVIHGLVIMMPIISNFLPFIEFIGNAYIARKALSRDKMDLEGNLFFKYYHNTLCTS